MMRKWIVITALLLSAPAMAQPAPERNLSLNDSEINQIYGVLKHQPWDEVSALMDKIRSQMVIDQARRDDAAKAAAQADIDAKIKAALDKDAADRKAAEPKQDAQ